MSFYRTHTCNELRLEDVGKKVKIEKLEILGKRTKELPFEVNANKEVREDLRLQYRYLDLRSEILKNNLWIVKHRTWWWEHQAQLQENN